MFIYSDSGRSLSKRPKQKNDCTVRAFSLAFHLTYDEAYDYLHSQGRQCGKGFGLPKYLERNPILLDHTVAKLSFPAVAGIPRIKVKDFVSLYPTGSYIIRIAKHVAYVHDGFVYDTFDTYSDKTVYTAFSVARIEPMQEEYMIKTAGEKLKVQSL